MLDGPTLDVLVVAAYGLILPQASARVAAAWLHQHPRFAAAALARCRADRARLLAGDARTGVSIMQMDTGSIRAGHPRTRSRCAPRDGTDAARHTRRRRRRGNRGHARRVRPKAASSRCRNPRMARPTQRKISREEAAIDWQAIALAIDRPVARFDPFPGRSHASRARRSRSGRQIPCPEATASPGRSCARTPMEWWSRAEKARSPCAKCSAPAADVSVRETSWRATRSQRECAPGLRPGIETISRIQGARTSMLTARR